MSDPAFTLRVRLSREAPSIVIRAYDDYFRPSWDSAGRVRLAVEVLQDGEVIFPLGQLYCAVHGASDGNSAKELVMSLVGMAPAARGGEGPEYYADYTADQLAWADMHHEMLGCERERRYCDPTTGMVR